MGDRRKNIVPIYYTPPDDETPYQPIILNRRHLSDPSNIYSTTPTREMLLARAEERALRRANRAYHRPVHWAKREEARERFDQTLTHRPGLVSRPLHPVAVRKIDFDSPDAFHETPSSASENMPQSSRNVSSSVTFRGPNQSDNFPARNATSTRSSQRKRSKTSEAISLHQLDDFPARNTRAATRKREDCPAKNTRSSTRRRFLTS